MLALVAGVLLISPTVFSQGAAVGQDQGSDGRYDKGDLNGYQNGDRRSQIQVFVSILPLRYFVEKVGGDAVSVSTMVGPGHSPATYEPTPRQLAALADAEVYFRIGVPFEIAWMDRIAALYPQLPIVDCRSAELRRLATELDPHVWTSPRNALAIAECVRETLSGLVSTGGSTGEAIFRERHDRLAARLRSLDAEIRQQLEQVGVKDFLVFHPAWGHFAREYGLTQIAFEQHGKTPGARSLAELLTSASREQIDVIVVQPQFSSALAETAAGELRATLVVVDPLSADYSASIRALTAALTLRASR